MSVQLSEEENPDQLFKGVATKAAVLPVALLPPLLPKAVKL